MTRKKHYFWRDKETGKMKCDKCGYIWGSKEKKECIIKQGGY